MSKLTEAIALSGALDQAMLGEILKWRLPATVPEGEPYTTADEAVAAIEDAQSSYDQVEIRVSDPDALRHYMTTRKPGKLRVVMEDATSTFDWEYGVTPMGDYILRWNDGTNTDVLCNGETCLLDGKRKVFFGRVQDLYFGDQRMFILCTPRKLTNGSTPE